MTYFLIAAIACFAWDYRKRRALASAGLTFLSAGILLATLR